jgi:hypothetical protein
VKLEEPTGVGLLGGFHFLLFVLAALFWMQGILAGRDRQSTVAVTDWTPPVTKTVLQPGPPPAPIAWVTFAFLATLTLVELVAFVCFGVRRPWAWRTARVVEWAGGIFWTLAPPYFYLLVTEFSEGEHIFVGLGLLFLIPPLIVIAIIHFVAARYLTRPHVRAAFRRPG